MISLDDKDAAAIREDVHAINNALNVVSMQAELVKVLASDSTAADRICVAIDTVLQECREAGKTASGISRRIKAAG